MTDTTRKDSVLRLALRGNAWFSVVTGVALFVAARPIADALGLTAALGATAALALVFGTGAALLLEGAGLFSLLRRRIIDPWLAGLATGADAAWLAATVVLFAIAGHEVPGAGRWLLAVVAPVVAAFAAVQSYGIWRAGLHRRSAA